MDGGCWVLAGWTCNERATMLYALYVLYVRVRGCRLWRYVRKCWGCYAMLSLCLLCSLPCSAVGADGKQRDAVSMMQQQVKEWATSRRLTGVAWVVLWPAKKKYGERGREGEGETRSGQVLMQCSRWVWFGLVWFLALVLGPDRTWQR